MEAAYDKARQLAEVTHQDKETRSSGGFGSIEKDLPALGALSNIPLADRFSSYLGDHNPIASEVNAETECVWLFDTTCYRPIHIYPHAQQPFQAEFTAAFFKKNSGADVSKIVASIADKIGLGSGDEDKTAGEKTIAKRLQPFVDTIAPARFVHITLPDKRQEKVGPGGRSGVAQQTIISIKEHHDGDRVEVPGIPHHITAHGPMTINFADPEGWLVVSDIDDSIKVTMTPSPIGILRSTFVSDPTPITGMPELYSQLATALHNPAWFYLSASPYNLYPFLRPFLHAHYPPGPILLRDASWMDLGGFLASLSQGTEAYKLSRLEKIHQWFPNRKIVCVGDSTQSDPEAYGDAARKYPGWIKAVFIRRVEDVAEMKNTDKNKPERFAKAFEGLDDGMWTTFFEDPVTELAGQVERLRGFKE